MRATSNSKQDHKEAPPSKKLGRLFAIVLLVVALLPMLRGAQPHYYILALGVTFAVVSATIPRLLDPITVVWLKIGDLLHVVSSPIIMAVVYYGTVVPTGIVQKLLGRDLLNLKMDPEATTYWISRTPPGPDADSMRQQF